MKYLAIILAAITFATSAPNKNVRISGGQNATSGQFPFIVALNEFYQFCDGSIIDNHWIITAARCLYGIILPLTTVLVGTHIEHSGGTEYNITKTIIHEDFDPVTRQNDIGLFQIDGELEFSDTIQPIELGEAEVNATCTVMGWGQTETVFYPDNLQYIETNILDMDYCLNISETYLDGYYLGPKQVCTLGVGGQGVCHGDWGGPLVCAGKLVGIASYGVVPCAKSLPDVFTKIAAYTKWIQDNIGTNI